MRFLLYILWSAVSLLVIVLVTVTTLLTIFHEEVENRLVHSIEQFTGRDIEVEGDFGFRFNPRPTIVANDIKMANADWASQPWMLEIDTLQASLSLTGLLKGKVNLYSVEGFSPRVLVEQNPVSGKINWQFGFKREPRPLIWLAEHLNIQTAQISDAQVKIQVGPIDHSLELGLVYGKTDFFSRLIDIQALGNLDGRPLRLSLELDNLRNMFLRKPTLIGFDGLHGATKITGRGEIADLLRWRGHNITLGLSVPSLEEVQGWVTTRLIETPQLDATAIFIQPEKWDSARFDDIQINSEAIGGQTRISGKVKQLRGLNGIDLKGQLNYPLASIMHWKGLESSTDTMLEAKLTLSGNKSEMLAFKVISASLLGEGIEIRGQGEVEHLLKPNTGGILFKGTATSLSKIGLINAKQWFVSEPLTGEFQLRKKAGRLALDNIIIRTFEGRAILEGELDDITRAQEGLFDFAAHLTNEDITRFNQLNESHIPVFKQTEIMALVDMQRSNFAARDITLNLRSDGLLMTGKGDMLDIKTLQVKDAKVTLEVDSIKNINTQFSSSFPELGQLQASGEAYGDINNTYNINLLKLILNNKHQIFSASGKLRRLGPEMTAKLDIVADIQSVTNIPPLLESSAKVPGQLQGKGTATLIAERADDWSFSDIKINFEGENQGLISGSVKHFPGAPDFAIIADFRRISPLDLPPFDLIHILQPENIRAYVQITKKAGQDYFALNNIDSHFSLASGTGSVNIAGNISDINHFEGLELLIGLSASNINSVPYLSALPFKEGLSGTATIKLSGKPTDLGITLSSVNIADTDLRGELKLQNPQGGKPKLEGQLHSRNLDLLKLLKQEKRKQLFSDEPLEFDWLNELDANLVVKADHFNGAISKLEGVVLKISIQNGVLNMPDMNGTVGNGKLAAWLIIAAQNKPYNIVTSLKAENVKPEHINLFGDSGFIRGGNINIDIGLGGSGVSIADYMGNSYGKIQLQLTNSSLKHRNLKLFGADLISGVLEIIDTLSRKSIYLPIECGVIHFPVVKGKALASQGIAIKTDKITVLGGGIIDLETEGLEIIIRPKARQGLGISVGTVANVVKISGSINQPKIAIDTSALVESSATIGAAIVSGGWSLLAQGLLARNKANSDVCHQTLTEPNNVFFKQAEDTFEEIHKR